MRRCSSNATNLRDVFHSFRAVESKVQSPKSEVLKIGGLPRSSVSPSSFLSGSRWGCWQPAAPGPAHSEGVKPSRRTSPRGVIEQTLLQGENPSQASTQTQETVKVRTYTLPVGSRIEQSQLWEGEHPCEPTLLKSAAEIRACGDARPPGHQQPSTLNAQPSTSFLLTLQRLFEGFPLC